MAEPTSVIPPGVYPYLSVSGGAAAIAFYVRAFGAVEEFKNLADDGARILHARLRINGAAVLLSDDFPEYRGGSDMPAPSGVTIHLAVDDADLWWRRAVQAGATVRMELADQFWGDRYGQLVDPFGHTWSIGAPTPKG